MVQNMENKGKTKKEEPKSITKKCAVCPSAGTLKCSNCDAEYYCSKDHQKQHWKEHKVLCKPFVIKINKVFGRYLVASRNIKQGELLLKESPTVVGPPIEAAPLCLNCYKPISPKKKPFCCKKCQIAPYCSPDCNAKGHNNAECEKFKNNPKLTPENLVQNCQIIMPLRCFLLKQSDPVKWKALMEMEAHMEKRRDTPIWRNHKINIEEVFFEYGLLDENDVEDDLVQKICGILDVNTFELRIPGFELGANPNFSDCLRGIYLQAALMAHDCIGNTHLAVDDNFSLIVHASIPISKGTPIYFNYTNALQGTHERQEHLKEGKYFDCFCQRCSDPSECGTHMSSLMCSKCRKGLVMPTQPTKNLYNKDSIWQCSEKKCSQKFMGHMIGTTVNHAKMLIENLDKTDIRSVEAMIKKLLESFCPGHSLILDLKQCLIGLHSGVLRRDPNPNRKILNRKLELCKELVPVFEKVEPGISRLKGITYYEMHIPMVVIANREYDNGEISAEILLKTLLEGEEILKQAISILLYEPGASPEGRLASRAMSELKLLRNSISSVEQIVENKKHTVEKRRKKKNK